MDLGNHFLSGVVICFLKPVNPDPTMNKIEIGLILAGSLIADAPVSLIWRKIEKITKKKSVLGSGLTEDDWSEFAPEVKPWFPIYKFLHSFVFLFFSVLIEILFFGNLFFSWGILAHQIYDLPTHKYKNPEVNPKPFYPLFDWTFLKGLTNNWTWKWYDFAFWWLVHGLVIEIIFACKG